MADRRVLRGQVRALSGDRDHGPELRFGQKAVVGWPLHRRWLDGASDDSRHLPRLRLQPRPRRQRPAAGHARQRHPLRRRHVLWRLPNGHRHRARNRALRKRRSRHQCLRRPSLRRLRLLARRLLACPRRRRRSPRSLGTSLEPRERRGERGPTRRCSSSSFAARRPALGGSRSASYFLQRGFRPRLQHHGNARVDARRRA
mmetsp:Transcript_21400/g.40236  ORF Transcript_21400/g.40236 Transcript_21400/m.40236 type:complete len:201 (-) Transcript_21400:330-932(-)